MTTELITPGKGETGAVTEQPETAAGVSLGEAFTPQRPATLYAICEELQAWTDTLDLVEARLADAADDEERLQLQDDQRDIELAIGGFLMAAGDKVDRFNAFVNQLEADAKFARSEEIRIAEYRHALEQRIADLEAIAKAALVAAGVKKITGRTSMIRVQPTPASVKEVNAAEIPAGYWKRTLVISGADWDQWRASLSLLDQQIEDERPHLGKDYLACMFDRLFTIKDASLEKDTVRRALKANVAVPGATLVTDKQSLVRK